MRCFHLTGHAVDGPVNRVHFGGLIHVIAVEADGRVIDRDFYWQPPDAREIDLPSHEVNDDARGDRLRLRTIRVHCHRCRAVTRQRQCSRRLSRLRGREERK